GQPAATKPGATLVFEIELLEVVKYRRSRGGRPRRPALPGGVSDLPLERPLRPLRGRSGAAQPRPRVRGPLGRAGTGAPPEARRRPHRGAELRGARRLVLALRQLPRGRRGREG